LPAPGKSLGFSDFPPYPATGTKVGEVGPTSALIHTYLLADPPSVLLQQPYASRSYAGMAGVVVVEYSSAELPDVGLVPRSQEEFARYQRRASDSRFTPWVDVPQSFEPVSNPSNQAEQEALHAALATDYSARVAMAGLQPETQYHLRIWIRGGLTALVRPGRIHHFRTAPAPDAIRDVSFIATTCFNHSRLKDLHEGKWPVQGFRMHRALLDLVREDQLSFDFAVINGDTVYLDKQQAPYRPRPESATQDMRARFFDSYALPLAREFFRQFPAYFLKDDHDWRFNDADPLYHAGATPPRFYWQIGKLYRGPPGPFLGKTIFEEMVPIERGTQTPPYRTFRWGRSLQIWLLELRECRYPNERELDRYGIEGLSFARSGQYDEHLHYPDYCGRPSENEAWGERQFTWLVESLKSSDADFKIVVSPTPVLGPDQDLLPELSLQPLRLKADNHVRRFRKEFEKFLDFLRRERLTNIYFVAGDRHFVWHSRYQTRDGQFTLHEFGSGPFADDIVSFGDVFYQDEHGTAELVAAQAKAGFVHIQVKGTEGDPRLQIDWYTMEDWETATVRRWEHSFHADSLRRRSGAP
jgi:phosphodiesterase/alkaline phosphatase D-like protein